MRPWISYAGLTRQEFSNRARLAWRRSPAIHLLHTTEGGGYPSAETYRQGQSAPHFTVDLRARTARQHYPLTEGAWALRAPSGVATNTGGAIQYELIGSCVRGGKVWSVLDATDEGLRYLAGLLRAVSVETGIPLTSSVEFMAYPASYGGSRVRMSPAAWSRYTGIAGHQHVPGNSHGDPGAFPIVRLLRLLGAPADPAEPPTPEPERDDDMIADIDALYRYYLGRDPKTDPAARAEADGWLIQAMNEGRDVTWIKQRLNGAPEARENAVKAEFRRSIGREATAEDIANWTGGGNAKATADAIRAGIAGSPEATARR